jgi:hypothetical protein
MAIQVSNPTGHPFLISDGFQRRLCRFGALIECRCVHCGFRFIGSVSHSLATVESIHQHECSKKKAPQRASVNATEDRRNCKVRKAHA